MGVGDTVAAMLANTRKCSSATSAFRCGRGPQHAEHATRREAIAFMLEHGGAKVLIADREFSGTVARALAALKERPFVIDVDDPEYSGAGERIGQAEYERFIAGGDPNMRGRRRRRMERDFAQLHLGHDRQPQGRGLPSPGRLSECDLQHRDLGHAASLRIPLDPADVPLQWLVLSVDHGRQCRHECVLAQVDAGLVFDAIRSTV